MRGLRLLTFKKKSHLIIGTYSLFTYLFINFEIFLTASSHAVIFSRLITTQCLLLFDLMYIIILRLALNLYNVHESFT